MTLNPISSALIVASLSRIFHLAFFLLSLCALKGFGEIYPTKTVTKLTSFGGMFSSKNYNDEVTVGDIFCTSTEAGVALKSGFIGQVYSLSLDCGLSAHDLDQRRNAVGSLARRKEAIDTSLCRDHHILVLMADLARMIVSDLDLEDACVRILRLLPLILATLELRVCAFLDGDRDLSALPH